MSFLQGQLSGAHVRMCTGLAQKPFPTLSIPSYSPLLGPLTLKGHEVASEPGRFIHPSYSHNLWYCLQSFSSILAPLETPWFPIEQVFL